MVVQSVCESWGPPTSCGLLKIGIWGFLVGRGKQIDVKRLKNSKRIKKAKL